MLSLTSVYGISTTLTTYSHCHRFLSQSPKRQEVALFRFFSHKRDKSRAETHRQDVEERGTSESNLS